MILLIKAEDQQPTKADGYTFSRSDWINNVDKKLISGMNPH